MSVLRGIESDLVYTKYQGPPPNTFYGLESYCSQLKVDCLKIGGFLLVISKLIPALPTVQLGTIRYNQINPGIIQAYSNIFTILCYPDILDNVVCPEH